MQPDTFRISQCSWVWLFLIITIFSGVATAAGVSISNFNVPYKSYIYDFWGNAVPAPQAYLPSHRIKGEDLGVGSFKSPRDLHVSSTGDIYIADTGNDRVLIFNSNWQSIGEISTFINDGAEDSLAQPRGVFVTEDESIYVADTNNARIVHFDKSGEMVRIIGEPQSDLDGIFPAGFQYSPQKVAVDGHGRIYAISQDLAEGFISFYQDGQFRGFVGAPKVVPDLTDYIWSRIATREQRARMQLFLPTEYTNFTIDEMGYIYATSHDEDEGEQRDKIVRLNASGENLLRGTGFHKPMGDVEYPSQWTRATRTRASRLVDVTVRENGIYSVLDRNRGRVFTYDKNDNLLYVFGYRGTNKGEINEAAALDSIGNEMLVLDSQQEAILLYQPTDYALLIHAALDAYNRGDYKLTENTWRKVLELNANYDQAYSGIGNALLRRDEYAEAMYHFKLGNDRDGYSKAFELYRRGRIYENFTVGVLVTLGIVLLGIAFNSLRRKRSLQTSEEVAATKQVNIHGEDKLNTRFSRFKEALKTALNVTLHPIDGFYRLKYENEGSMTVAMLILALLSGTFVFARQYTAFLFNTADLTRLNVPMEVASIIVPFFLWCAVNWSLTTLMEGKGTFRDVVIASAYALIPLILTMIPLTVISNYLIQREGAFYYFGMSLGTGWTLILMVFGSVMSTHEYDLPKTIWTCIFTAAGMVFALFLGFLFFNLSEQVFTFINDIITEIVFRM